jgi:hypothetical protein
MESKPIKAYKGFNKDLSCRGFQYEVGKEYEHNNPVIICNSGFHACENPIDCLKYYAPGQSVYHEVELSGDTGADVNDSKIAAQHIKIGARLDIAGICKATFDYVKSKCTNENNAESGKPATAGENGAATAGNNGAATAGENGAATAGKNGAATAGKNGAATAGENGAATAGENGAATSRGRSSSGDNGLSVARGNNVRVRGGMGAVLVIVEENESNYDIASWKAAIVDGSRIKADTWYKLVDGEFAECDD